MFRLSPDLNFYWVYFSSLPLVINSLLEFLWGRGSFCLIFIRSSINKVPSALDPFKIKRHGAGDFIGAPEPCGFHHSVASLCGPSPQSVDSAVTWSTFQTWTNLMGSSLWISPSSCGITLWSCGPHVEFLRGYLTKRGFHTRRQPSRISLLTVASLCGRVWPTDTSSASLCGIVV